MKKIKNESNVQTKKNKSNSKMADDVRPVSHKVILIILDGLTARVAEHALGFIHSLVEAGAASHHIVRSELPSMSRPLYETILTGKTPYESGITVNPVVRLSKEKSIFHYASSAGLTTAAAAYYWISELYNYCPFDKKNHRYQNDLTMPIQHGIFYTQDTYPDSELFQDAEYLRRTYDPNFLLIHPMSIDNAGHQFGVNDAGYLNAAREVDMLMGLYIPDWLCQGYQIVITSDHGMDWDKLHGGTSEDERNVPLYALGKKSIDSVPKNIKQTDIIKMVLALLDVKI